MKIFGFFVETSKAVVRARTDGKHFLILGAFKSVCCDLPLFSSDNTKLYVKNWGAGRPVTLLYGWPLSADSWDDQAMAIADAGFRAIANRSKAKHSTKLL